MASYATSSPADDPPVLRIAGTDRPAEPEEGGDAGRARWRLFDALNALADEWAAVLPPMELKVILLFIRHADHRGIAWPSPALMARKLAANVRNVERAVAALEARGLLAIAERGGGRGHPTKRRVTIPAKVGDAPAIKSASAAKHRRTAPVNGPANTGARGRQTPARARAKHRRTAPAEGTIEQLREHTMRAGVAADRNGGVAEREDGGEANGVSPGPEEHKREQRRRALSIAGVVGSKLPKLSVRPDLDPLAALYMLLDIDPATVKSVPAVVVSRVESGDVAVPDLVSVKTAHAMIGRGWIESVAGQPVAGAQVTYNDGSDSPRIRIRGAGGSDATIPAARLRPSAFRIADPSAGVAT